MLLMLRANKGAGPPTGTGNSGGAFPLASRPRLPRDAGHFAPWSDPVRSRCVGGSPAADAHDASAQPPALDRERFGRVVLVLQGGGAMGAYQGGVFQALAEAGIAPD